MSFWIKYYSHLHTRWDGGHLLIIDHERVSWHTDSPYVERFTIPSGIRSGGPDFTSETCPGLILAATTPTNSKVHGVRDDLRLSSVLLREQVLKGYHIFDPKQLEIRFIREFNFLETYFSATIDGQQTR